MGLLFFRLCLPPRFGRFEFPPCCHQGFVTSHAEIAMRGPRISQALYLPVAVPTPETGGAECMIACQDCQVFDLVATYRAAVSAIVADQKPIS